MSKRQSVWKNTPEGVTVRRNRLSEQWASHPIEMLQSPAWRALSLSARKVLDRIAIELASHGGNDIEHLPVTKEDFVEYGVSPRLVAAAIREAEALGFIRITQRGRGGNAEHRKEHQFFPTYLVGRNKALAPPHDWRRIKTNEEAEQIARVARANKNPNAVANGKSAWRKNRNRVHKVYPKPGPQSVPETGKFPGPQSVPTGVGHKVYLLSISRPGGGGEEAAFSSEPAWLEAVAGLSFQAPAKRPDELAKARYLAAWYREGQQDLPAAA
jgi:hypothetical protein